MAHGFLTPQAVSGDRFWQNAKDLLDLFAKIKGRKAKKADPKGGPLMAFQQKGQQVEAVKVDVVQDPQKSQPKTSNFLGNSPVAKMLGAGKSDIVAAQKPALPPSLNPKSKGGSFTNLPGISAAPKKLDADVFFKAAQTGVDPQTGRYLSSEERKDFLKKSKAQMNAPASVASAGITSASAEITKGDEAVIGAVTDLSKIVTNLVDAVKAQTASQKQIADKEKATADKLANRALAQNEKNALGEVTKSSGTLTPVGGMGSMSLGGGKGSGGGGLGGPALGVGGKVLAQAVGKRGVGRIGTRLAAKYGGKVAAKAAGRFGAKAAAGMGLKTAGGAVAKSLGKKIPLLGLGLGSIFAVQRAFKGDWLGAGMELASGAASTIPGIGTAGSIGIDAALAARDMGATPFAKGGIISSPTLSLMGEGNKKEGVFPLQGKEGKKTFEMFGQGMIDAQKKNKRDYASIQSAGLRQYYENEGGSEKLAKSLANVWGKITGVLGSLFSGTLNSLMSPANAAAGNPADYLDSGIGGSTAERNAAAFLSTLEGGSGQTAADTFQVMLNRTANAKSGGSMKAYGTTLFDQITAQSQFSPFSAAINDRPTGDRAADEKYGKIRSKLGKNAAERKAKLLEIAGQPDGLAKLQQLFGAGSGSAAAKVLADFESSGVMSKSSAQFVGGAMSFRGYQTEGSRRRAEGGNYIFGAAQGTKAASLNAVSAEPTSGILGMGRLPGLPPTDTMHGQAYGANRRGGRKHAGVDFDIKGNEKFFSRIGGVVTKIGYDPSGYGNYVDIYNDQLKVTERIAEGARVLVQQGQKIAAGTPIVQGETDTGVIHYEIRKDGGGFGLGGTVNPLNFLASINKKAEETARSGGGSPTANRGGQRGSGSSPGSINMAAANPNTGNNLSQTSSQVSMATMGLTSGGGNTTVNNIYNSGGSQQGTPSSNSLSPGASASSTLFNWKAARR